MKYKGIPSVSSAGCDVLHFMLSIQCGTSPECCSLSRFLLLSFRQGVPALPEAVMVLAVVKITGSYGFHIQGAIKNGLGCWRMSLP